MAIEYGPGVGRIDVWANFSRPVVAFRERDEYRAMYPKACYAIDVAQVAPDRFIVGANLDQPRQPVWH